MKQIFTPEEHPRGEDEFVYDNEHIHYGILRVLCEGSPTFAQKFLMLSVAPKHISIRSKPEKGLFDLLFEADNEQHYSEIKIWAQLEPSQFQRQTAFLAACGAKGIYLLFTKAAAAWSHRRVSDESAGVSRVVNGKDLLTMLASLGEGVPNDVLEVADAYRKVLESLNGRY